MLPGKSGFDVCRDLRARGIDVRRSSCSPPRARRLDKIVGLKLGADDYVTKPFALARAAGADRGASSAAAGRGRAEEPPPLPSDISFGEVRITPRSLRGSRGGQPIELTPREMKVLAVLWREAGNVVERNRLLDEVWGEGYEGTTRTLDQVILKLRAKLEADPARPRHILTVHGAGYRFEA